jgi:hypothetical protein
MRRVYAAHERQNSDGWFGTYASSDEHACIGSCAAHRDSNSGKVTKRQMARRGVSGMDSDAATNELVMRKWGRGKGEEGEVKREREGSQVDGVRGRKQGGYGYLCKGYVGDAQCVRHAVGTVGGYFILVERGGDARSDENRF